MQESRTRAASRAKAKVRSWFGIGALLAFTSGARAATPEWIPAEDSNPGLMVYEPQGDRSVPRPITVMLHGMCGLPENECPHFASTVTRDSWLVCPRATKACPNGGATWSLQGRSETVEAAVARVVERYPGRVDPNAERTLIGFSLGAFVALDLAEEDPGRWSRLVLIGAKIHPDAAKLQKNGVLRVLLASGDFDLSREHMVAVERRLRKSGTVSTFMSLGGVGHRFAKDMPGWLSRALEWIHGENG